MSLVLALFTWVILCYPRLWNPSTGWWLSDTPLSPGWSLPWMLDTFFVFTFGYLACVSRYQVQTELLISLCSFAIFLASTNGITLQQESHVKTHRLCLIPPFPLLSHPILSPLPPKYIPQVSLLLFYFPASCFQPNQHHLSSNCPRAFCFLCFQSSELQVNEQ